MSYPGGPHQYDPYSGQSIPHEYPPRAAQFPQFSAPGDFGASAYRGFGAYDPEPPRRSRTPVVLAVVAALVLLGGGGAVAYFLTRGSDEEPDNRSQQVPPTSATSSSAAPSSTSTPPPTTSRTKRFAKVEPVVPGWQPVLSQKEGAIFDVPDDWTVESPDTLTGFEDGAGRQVIMHGVATYREGFCKKAANSYRGGAGFMTAGTADPKKVPQIAAKLWATAAGELPKDSPKVTASAPKRVTIEGGQEAWMSSAVVKNPVKSECPPPSLKVTAVAFVPREGGDTALFIMHTDQGVDDLLPPGEAKKIIGSLRADDD